MGLRRTTFAMDSCCGRISTHYLIWGFCPSTPKVFGFIAVTRSGEMRCTMDYTAKHSECRRVQTRSPTEKLFEFTLRGDSTAQRNESAGRKIHRLIAPLRPEEH